jgi:hypothetical protein
MEYTLISPLLLFMQAKINLRVQHPQEFLIRSAIVRHFPTAGLLFDNQLAVFCILKLYVHKEASSTLLNSTPVGSLWTLTLLVQYCAVGAVDIKKVKANRRDWVTVDAKSLGKPAL